MTKKFLKLVIIFAFLFTLFGVNNVYADDDENFVIGGTHPDLPTSNTDNQYSQGNSQVVDTGTTGTTSTTTSATGSTGTGTGSSSSSGSAPASILPDRPSSLPDLQVENVINRAIQIIFAVGQISFVIVLLVGGVMFITSAGNEQQAEKAKKLLLFAIIGIVVLFSAWAIATFVVQQLSSA